MQKKLTLILILILVLAQLCACGKCVHCRLGTRRMLDILIRITEGEGQPGDIELLEETLK